MKTHNIRRSPVTPCLVARDGTGRTACSEQSTLLRALGPLRHWARLRRGRLALARLCPRLIADIGLTRTEAGREARKPFWRR